MPRTTSQNFKDLRDAQTGSFQYLYSIYDYDGSTDLHYINDIANLVFDGVTYKFMPISHNAIGENTTGQIDTVGIKIENVSRIIQAYLELYDFRGLKVTIKTVLDVTDITSILTDTYYIDSYTAGQFDVNFICKSKLDIHNVMLPSRRYTRQYCQWDFKSTECGYAGAETECNKTFQRCKVLLNRERFGGFPSIKSGKIFT